MVNSKQYLLVALDRMVIFILFYLLSIIIFTTIIFQVHKSKCATKQTMEVCTVTSPSLTEQQFLKALRLYKYKLENPGTGNTKWKLRNSIPNICNQLYGRSSLKYIWAV